MLTTALCKVDVYDHPLLAGREVDFVGVLEVGEGGWAGPLLGGGEDLADAVDRLGQSTHDSVYDEGWKPSQVNLREDGEMGGGGGREGEDRSGEKERSKRALVKLT